MSDLIALLRENLLLKVYNCIRNDNCETETPSADCWMPVQLLAFTSRPAFPRLATFIIFLIVKNHNKFPSRRVNDNFKKLLSGILANGITPMKCGSRLGTISVHSLHQLISVSLSTTSFVRSDSIDQTFLKVGILKLDSFCHLDIFLGGK